MKNFLFFTLSVLNCFITYNQNVGIGTTTPANQLSVKGNADFTGNVGIGISSPVASLMINSSVNPQLLIRQTNSADFARIRMQSGTDRFWDIASFNDTKAVGNERLHFYNSLTGNILTLAGNGNVGIGNGNPNVALSFPAEVGKKISLHPGNTGDVGFDVWGNELRIHTDVSNADITFGYDTYKGPFTEQMRIKGNGNVGIGVSGPTASLEIARGIGVDGTIKLRGTTYNSYFNSSADENTIIRGGKDVSNIFIGDKGAGKIFIGGGSGNGNIEISSSNPNANIELRQTNAIKGGTPFIDFTSDPFLDYNMRLILTGSKETNNRRR